VHVAEAGLRLQGLAGFRDGVGLVRQLLAGNWDTVHPQLDADDNNDPTFRLNSLLPLADPQRVLSGLRATYLVVDRVAGRFSYRDYLQATGEMPPSQGDEEKATADVALISAAFRNVDLETLQATAAALSESRDEIKAIEAVISEKVGGGLVPEFASLTDLLKDMHRLVAMQLAERGVGDLPGTEPGVAPGASTVGGGGEVRSREDALRLIDRICAYFEQHEPSSPVPLILRRAKRLVGAGFIDILRDMAPAGVGEAETIAGLEAKE
jgi:type VI secretion system protein ImpA